ncbi:hypothetical protein CDD83_5394 [Cordyceps sp. RAO-2017]|nr:hypothetical protein CDD83_5394 [Cordyceps sp. RAO-2017]
MTSDAEPPPQHPHRPQRVADDDNDDGGASPLEPATPRDSGPPPSLSQVTLPSTEIPGSPIEPSQSFRTEALDDGPPATVIPSSLTPPSSTQMAAQEACADARRPGSPPAAAASTLFSPPATVHNHWRDRDPRPGYVAPTPQQVLDAPPDELRAMLQTCIAENQRLKTEAAHHKLQLNLLSLQAEEDSMRAAVEHDMVRRQVDALRLAEHSRQARRELSAASDSIHAKYVEMKALYDEAVDEIDALRRRNKAAKKLIHQTQEETISLTEERDLLLTRIRENREHFHMLCSPGGIFHGAMTPKQPQQPQHHHGNSNHHSHHRVVAHHHPSRPPRRDDRRDDREAPEHGLSALIQAMSQDNNSAPSTPTSSHRVVQRYVGKHSRNAQSMSSLPTTPLPRARDPSLLPSADLVSRTDPRLRQQQQPSAPATSTPQSERRQRKSRESTISMEDNEELARQAVESAAAAAAQSIASQALRSSEMELSRRRAASGGGGDGGDDDKGDYDGDVFGSQASRAAAEMLRRKPGNERYEAMPDRAPGPVEKSVRMQARLLSDPRSFALDKRKYGGAAASADEGGMREQGSPPKRMRVGGPLTENQRVGLGIQYGER